MLTIKNSHIRITGYFLLLFSIIIFLLSWLHWYISIPSCALLLFAFFKLTRNIKADNRVFRISIRTILLIVLLVLAWVLFSGVGGAFPQKADMHWRNAILHDLINYQWPVSYKDGFDSSLTYYIAFWMIPALLGKSAAIFFGVQAGWIVANIVVILYCSIIIVVIVLLLISHLDATSMKRVLLLFGVLVFFSGMDIIPTLISQAGKEPFVMRTHLEWYTYIEYSAMTTQLSWVVNQAVPAWLVTSLLLHEKKMNHFAFLGLMLLPFGPLPFLGIIILMIPKALRKLLGPMETKDRWVEIKQLLSIPNVVATGIILPIYFFYYSSNATASGSGIGWNQFNYSGYTTFVIIEFLFILILVWRHSYKTHYFITSVIGLFLIPLISFGNGQDFCMRVSIPLLFILMINVMNYLLHNIQRLDNTKKRINLKAIPLVMILAIGAMTPLTEYYESYVQIKQSESHCTSIYADRFGTLDNGQMERDNFITQKPSDSFFYRYLAKVGK